MNGHPATLPLDLYRGDDYTFQVRMWSDVAHTVPLPLDGVTARAEIQQGETVMVMEAVVTLPNIIDVSIYADDWTLASGSARWDLQLIFADGTVYTMLAGAVDITGDIVQ